MTSNGTTSRRIPALGAAGLVAVVLGAVVLVAALIALRGGDGASTAAGSADATTPELVTTTMAPTTTTPPSTTSTTSTTTTTTTTPTTLVRQASLPVPPPADARGPEDNPPMGRIAIPSIGLDTELQQGIRLTTLDRGPGHWPGTAEPGQIGNVVVAAHRTSHGAEFRHLDRLVPGDPVVFSTATGTHTYRVTGTQIVLPDALWITDPTDTPTATLFACHPLGSTRERIVVTLALESSQPPPTS